MSLSPQISSHKPAVAPAEHISNVATPNHPPSAVPQDNPTHTKDHTKHRADGSTTTTSNPPFTPFFTLVEDINTTQHHHPTVHYIFSDDSTDLITEAALRTLDPHSPSSSTAPQPQHHEENNNNNNNNNNTTTTTTTTTTGDDSPTDPRSPLSLSLLPPPRPNITDRYILLDLALPSSPSTTAIPSAHAHSLTPDWQVLNVEVSRAPTWDADPDPGAAEGNRGLMLKIQGTEGVRDGLEVGIGSGRGDGDEGREGEVEMEGLVRVFEKRMGELRRLIDVEGGVGGGGE